MSNNFLPLQAQPFSLAGSGAIIGDTSLTLKSFTDIDGNLITMSELGLVAFMTLEPGNGTLEEQISFSGVTQNTNGTATLTGVSSVTFASPYTKTSGLKKTHAGSTIAILSNTSGFYNQFVAKDDDGTISEVLTFTAPNYPQIDVPATLPTLDGQFATKKYVDGVAVSGAPNANTTTKGIVQIGTQADVDNKVIFGSTSAYVVVTPNTQRSTLASDYIADTSVSANTILIAPSPAITSYLTGQQFSFKVANTNTSVNVTLNVNGLGAKNVVTLNGTTSPNVSDMISGQVIVVEYNGAAFQVISPSANTVEFNNGAYPAGNGAAITGLTQYVKKISIAPTPVTFNSSTAENILFTTTLPGGSLSTNNGVRTTVNLSNTQTSGGVLIFRAKYGASTVVTTPSVTVNPTTSGYVVYDLFANASAAVQVGNIQIIVGASAFTFTTGSSAVDSTIAQTLAVTAQLSNNGSNDKITASSTICELIQ